MTINSEKNKNLNFEQNDKEDFLKEGQQKPLKPQLIFREMIKNSCKDLDKEQIFLLILIIILKRQKVSNQLILALLYIFM